MAKNKSAGESAADKKRRSQQKKPAAPKAAAKKPAAAPKPAAAKAAAPKPAPAKKPGAKAKPSPKKARDAQAELPIAPVDVVEDAEILAETPVEVIEGEVAVEEAPAPLSPEEQELQAIYGDDLVKPAIAHGEYQDRQTADEDRPMVPEINARDERKQQWQERREHQQGQRGQGQRFDRAEPPRGNNEQPRGNNEHRAENRGNNEPRNNEPRNNEPRNNQGQRPSQPAPAPIVAVPAPVANGAEHDALARVGTPLGDAVATVFTQLRNGQPLPVRQLAQMMRKRNLTEVDPEQLWPQLKAELLGDERSYRALGLRPRIVYRGRDLFAPGPVASSQTAEAEASVAGALSRLAGATHRALAARIAKATPAGFERLIHAYLVGAGYRDIEWVKRVGGISYAQALAPGLGRSVLLSARSGDQPIDRRGIGELRVGVEAKDLVAGVLFSAGALSEDAERELERAGRSIAVMCGDQLVAALIASGVGVVSAAAPLHYVDDQLLDELLAG